MAPSVEHGLGELAKRLEHWADAIENPGAHEAEQDIRRAAKLLREVEDPTPLVQKLVAELRKVATFSADFETRQTLRALLGEAQHDSAL
jgi:hypothetical protein